MVAGNTATVPKEILDALEALERLVVRYQTIPRDRAEAAAEHLTRDFPGVTLELDKKPEELAPPPESPRPARPPRRDGMGGRGPRRPRRPEGEAPQEGQPQPEGTPTEPPAEGAPAAEPSPPAEPQP